MNVLNPSEAICVIIASLIGSLKKPNLTLYEALSVIISSFSSLVTFLGFLITFIAVLVAIKQLRRMAQSAEAAERANYLSIVNTVLKIEEHITNNRTRLANASIELVKLNGAFPRSEEQINIAKLRFDEARENYLNSMDRLCACIIRGIIPEEEYRKDYFDGLTEIMEGHKELLGDNSRFNNIIELYKKWQKHK